MMAQTPMSIDSILVLMERVPAALIESTSMLGDADLYRRVEPDQWSVAEIVAHLRASADVRGEQRIERMLAGDAPTIRTVSPRNEAVAQRYAATPFQESVQALLDQRARLLEHLRALPPTDWSRGAKLTGIRPVRFGTVHGEADALVRHEVRHLSQVRRTTGLLLESADPRPRTRRRAPIRSGR